MNEIENGARRLDRLWYLVVYGGTGAACAAAWLFLRFGGGALNTASVVRALGHSSAVASPRGRGQSGDVGGE